MWTGSESPEPAARWHGPHLGREEGASRPGDARGRGGLRTLVGSPHVQGSQETHPATNWADMSAPTKSASALGPVGVDQPGVVCLPGPGAWRVARARPMTAVLLTCEPAEGRPSLGIRVRGFSRTNLISLCFPPSKPVTIYGRCDCFPRALARHAAPAESLLPRLPVCSPPPPPAFHAVSPRTRLQAGRV